MDRFEKDPNLHVLPMGAHHCGFRLAAAAQRGVSRGEVRLYTRGNAGKAGSAGNATIQGPHLQFEMLFDCGLLAIDANVRQRGSWRWL